MRRLGWLILLILALTCAAASAEVLVSFTPEKPRMGDVVDVDVKAGEGAKSVIYSLSTEEGKVFSGKEDAHFQAAFRPRTEKDHLLSVTVVYEDGTKESAQVTVPVSGQAEIQQGRDVLYSQKDGWWKNKSYSKKTSLEKSGCAIFALSHAVQRLGYEGEDTLPETMGKTYAGCYVQGGTANARLLDRASALYNFTSESELYESAAGIADALRNGDFFSFSIVIGHIALIDGIAEDGKHVHIVDSAPGATFERIKKGNIYYLDGEGNYVAAEKPEDMPGFRYYFETRYCGGMEYYMDLSYVTRRGARLIRPAWLLLKTGEGTEGVSLVQPGSAFCVILRGAKKEKVPTADLQWGDEITGGKMAVVSKKAGTKLLDADGKKIRTLSACTILPVIREEGKQLVVVYDGRRGFIARADAEIVPVIRDATAGVISVKGNTSGNAEVKIRFGGSAKEKIIDHWKTGTEVAVIKKSGGFCQVEGKGLRAWVQEDYVTVSGQVGETQNGQEDQH